jgi:dephospho-CoA kinase
MNASPASTEKRQRTTKPVVGLVGGIGSGKSLVARLLGEHGGYVIDADRLGHEALEQPTIRDQVVQRWGAAVLRESGAVDRRKLAAIVFADPAERRALEAMVFPWIERRIREEIAQADRDPQTWLVVLDAAILLETGWSRVCDVVIFVNAPRDQRLHRVAAQRGWTAKEVAAREQAQLSVEEKAARADLVVENSGDLAQTRAQLEPVVAQLRRALPQASPTNPGPASQSGDRAF